MCVQDGRDGISRDASQSVPAVVEKARLVFCTAPPQRSARAAEAQQTSPFQQMGHTARACAFVWNEPVGLTHTAQKPPK